LAHLAGFDKVGNRDRGKQTNDRNDDHDFHEREPSFLIAADFHFLPFSLSGVDERERPVYEYCVAHELPFTNRNAPFSNAYATR
jgi:hypothetical protein